MDDLEYLEPHLEDLEVVTIPHGRLQQHPDGEGQLIVLGALKEMMRHTDCVNSDYGDTDQSDTQITE